MTKGEFVAKLAASAGITKKQAEQVFSAFVETIKGSLLKNERIALNRTRLLSHRGEEGEKREKPQDRRRDQDTREEGREVLRGRAGDEGAERGKEGAGEGGEKEEIAKESRSRKGPFGSCP